MKTLNISNELHSKLKVIAVTDGISLQELITSVLRDFLNEKDNHPTIIKETPTPRPPATTPSELPTELKEYYRDNKHFVESTRTLMNCSLEEAIIMTIEADEELRKYN